MPSKFGPIEKQVWAKWKISLGKMPDMFGSNVKQIWMSSRTLVIMMHFTHTPKTGNSDVVRLVLHDYSLNLSYDLKSWIEDQTNFMLFRTDWKVEVMEKIPYQRERRKSILWSCNLSTLIRSPESIHVLPEGDWSASCSRRTRCPSWKAETYFAA